MLKLKRVSVQCRTDWTVSVVNALSSGLLLGCMTRSRIRLPHVFSRVAGFQLREGGEGPQCRNAPPALGA
jgi:hypothetical protein